MDMGWGTWEIWNMPPNQHWVFPMLDQGTGELHSKQSAQLCKNNNNKMNTKQVYIPTLDKSTLSD